VSLFKELQRRNVFRVALAYIVVSWLVLQVSDVLVNALQLPPVWSKALIAILLIGFIPVLVFAWVYELTPEGVKRESEVRREASITHQTGRKLNLAIVGLLVVAIALFAADRFLPGRAATATKTFQTPAESPQGTTPVVAVLPLQALSDEAEGKFLAAGLHDDLLTRLARLDAFKVISRTSVMEYANTTKNLRQIGAELGAGYIVEGALQALGGRVRISAELIDAKSDEHLWAQSFDRALDANNLFEVQGDIAAAIADALHTALSPKDVQVLDTRPTDNFQAYHAYLQGLTTSNSLTRPDLLATIAAFRQAVDLDPNFAEAWARLSVALVRRYWEEGAETGTSPDPALRDASARALQRAQALDPQGIPTLLAEAYYRYYGFRDFAAALAALDRAEALAPHTGEVTETRGYLLRRLGRLGEAADVLLNALLVAPNDINLMREILYTLPAAGRCSEAREIMARALAHAPRDNGILQSAALAELHCNADLSKAAELARRIDITTSYELGYVVRILACAGDFAGAIEILANQQDRWADDSANSLYVTNQLTWLYRQTGQADLARESLAHAAAIADRIAQSGTSELLEKAFTAALRGDAETTLRLGRKALAELPDDRWTAGEFHFLAAVAYAVAGADDEALGALQTMLQLPTGGTISLLSADPYLAPLRADPRFASLIAKQDELMGRPAATPSNSSAGG